MNNLEIDPQKLVAESEVLAKLEGHLSEFYDRGDSGGRAFIGGVMSIFELPLDKLRDIAASHPQYIEPKGFNGRPPVPAILEHCTYGWVTGYVTSCTRELAIRIQSATLGFADDSDGIAFMIAYPPVAFGNGPDACTYWMEWE